MHLRAGAFVHLVAKQLVVGTDPVRMVGYPGKAADMRLVRDSQEQQTNIQVEGK